MISVRDTALFTRRLATLLEAAVPLHEALAALVREEKNQHFHKILKEITAAVAEGASLSVALNKSPEVFKDSYRAMVAAGEAGGALAEVLKKLADFLEHQEKLQRSVTTASIYRQNQIPLLGENVFPSVTNPFRTQRIEPGAGGSVT